MNGKDSPPCILVLFGGTGDLTHRKLLPALFNLMCQSCLPDCFAVVAVGRRKKSDEEYRREAYDSIRKYLRYEMMEAAWRELSARLFYKEVDFEKAEGYLELETFLSQLDNMLMTKGNRVLYLAVAPGLIEIIIQNLNSSGITFSSGDSWQRIVIEKPFGSSLETARQLNGRIAGVIREENTYRIDHYLGKEMVQSIMGLRFFNAFFEPLWNNRYIDHVQISSCETLGVENRGEYYDKAGALGDMIQNHMLQILALLAMEPPRDFSAESVRDEKVTVLNAIQSETFQAAQQNIVFGQYSDGITDGLVISGYRQENKVAAVSDTETFVALKLQIDNARWQGVPFYIRTGKRLASKITEVVVQFKPYISPGSKDHLGIGGEPNLLVIKIQPEEELFVRFNTKKPGIQEKICPVKMSYCQNCKVCEAQTNSPEAYEKLLFDVINGDSTLFTRWDEVEKSWEVLEAIRNAKGKEDTCFPNYEPGSRGPKEADELLERDGRRWWHF